MVPKGPERLGDLSWCSTIGGVDPNTADALWPHIQLAETRRLTRLYGYPKDNAIPPAIGARLCDPLFVEDVRRSVIEASGATASLLRPLLRLVRAARASSDLGSPAASPLEPEDPAA